MFVFTPADCESNRKRMTIEGLREFLELKMRLSHIYQPLLIMALVDAGGSATVRQIAIVFIVTRLNI